MPKLAAFEEDRRFSQTRLFIDWRRQPAKRRPPRGVVDAGNSILWQVAQSLRPAGQIRKIPVAKAAVPEWRSSSSAPTLRFDLQNCIQRSMPTSRSLSTRGSTTEFIRQYQSDPQRANRSGAGSHPPTWTRTDVSAPLRSIVS
jgi:hypothetical protein